MSFVVKQRTETAQGWTVSAQSATGQTLSLNQLTKEQAAKYSPGTVIEIS